MSAKQSLKNWMNRMSPVRILLIFYFIAVIFSTLLLSLPIAYKPGVKIPFIDILFTAVSALSVTGLSTITIVNTLSVTGYFILLFILQLGALGVMASGTFIWLLFGKKIGLRERRLIMTDQNQTTFAGMAQLIKEIIYVVLLIELVGFLILGTYFLKYYSTAGEAYLNGLFTTISAITNGGFDITGASMFPYAHDYFVQLIVIILIVFGAIGFPVLIEIKDYIQTKRKKRQRFRFSLFTKITSVTFSLLVVFGTLFIYLMDKNHYLNGNSWHENFFYALFQSVTTRSAGLSTLDVNLLTESNQLFMSALMFIGASPSSAGGGIRTTTFAIVIIFLITYARGGKSLRIFKREIHNDDFIKAVTVTLMAVLLIFTSVIIVSIFESYSLIQILFEVTSAFGTVGLSLGITSELTTMSKIILMILMFIGRVGVVTFLFMFKSRRGERNYHYPTEKIIIG